MIYNDQIIEKISAQMSLMRKNGINEELTKEIIKLMSNDIKIPYVFKDRINAAAYYNTKTSTMFLSVNSMINWAKNYIKSSKVQEYYPHCVYSELLIYFYIFVLNHEMNHAFQHLIGQNIIKTNYPKLKNCYINLYDLSINQNMSLDLNNAKNTLQLLLFCIHRNNILERNANLEAMSLMLQLTKYENDDIMQEVIQDCKQTIQMQGYTGKYNGAIEEAYKKILIFQKDMDDENISLEDKVRYGYPLDEYTKKKVLNYEFE